MRAGRAGAFLAAAGLLLALPRTGAAHPLVDEGRRRFESADFDGALAALDRALEGDDLSRSELVRLLETRALVHQAMGDSAETDRALSALASLEPDYAFRPEVPPELRARFGELHPGSVRVELDVIQTAAGVRIDGTVRDPAELVRELRIHALADGVWQSAAGVLTVRAAAGGRIVYYAEAVGPGGALLATRGTRAEPLATTVAPLATRAHRGPARPRARDGSSQGPWLWVGIGAGAAVAVVVVVLLLGAGGDGGDVTQPGIPVVDF